MRRYSCISGGPPWVESAKSPVTVPKSFGLVWSIVVLRPVQLYHLKGLKKSNRTCALYRSLMVKSLYAARLNAMIRSGVHMLDGMLPLVNDGATWTQSLPTFVVAVPQLVISEFWLA